MGLVGEKGKQEKREKHLTQLGDKENCVNAAIWQPKTPRRRRCSHFAVFPVSLQFSTTLMAT